MLGSTARLARVMVMMSRPPVLVVLFLFAAIGMAQAGAAELLDLRFLGCLVVVALCFVHATTLNDIADEQIDRINIPQARGRPLLGGQASRAELVVMGSACAALALAIGFSVNPWVGLAVLAGVLFNGAYSLRPIRLSGRGLATSLLLPLGYTALPYLVGALSVAPGLSGRGWLILAAV
ncbi:MAG TPA: UbiA family prenyltransferase, partial [Candidatus Dormibacteraeota bacterium]|nr:UbiA family prenyltransferase [Candidatus Dormibacteraeota bacterium]